MASSFIGPCNLKWTQAARLAKRTGPAARIAPGAPESAASRWARAMQHQPSMIDCLLLLAIATFFALTLGYVRACEML
jgi:hypothetical protein